jgi:effector-binding domain-containing protein
MSEFKIETMQARPFAYITRTAKMNEIGKAMAEGFGALGAMFAKAGAAMAGMPMAHYRSYDTKTTTFDLGFPCRAEDAKALGAAGLSIGETPAGRNMTATHMGPYDTVVSTYDAMTAEMKSQGLKPASDMWEIYFSPPDTPPAKIRTDVVWPIAA